MNDAAPLPLTGRCMCERVRFEISEPLLRRALLPLQALSAANGQRLRGHRAHRTRLVQDRLRRGCRALMEPGRRLDQSFCGVCGGHLFSTNPDNPDLIAVRMGALDGDPGIRPAAHQFTDYAASWEPIRTMGCPLPRAPAGRHRPAARDRRIPAPTLPRVVDTHAHLGLCD